MSKFSNCTRCAACKQQRTALLTDSERDEDCALFASAANPSRATEMPKVRQASIRAYFSPIETGRTAERHLLEINRDDRAALRAHLTNTRVTEVLPAQYGTFVEVELGLLSPTGRSPTGSTRGDGSACDVDLEKGVVAREMKASRRARRKVKLEPIRPEWWMWVIIVLLVMMAVAEFVWVVRVW